MNSNQQPKAKPWREKMRVCTVTVTGLRITDKRRIQFCFRPFETFVWVNVVDIHMLRF